MKKKYLTKWTALCLAFATISFVGCGKGGSDENEGTSEIRQVYTQYVIHAAAKGEEVLSYEAWLASIKGKDGKSAYQIWLENGHTGSQEDFLNWLKADGTSTGKHTYGDWTIFGEEVECGRNFYFRSCEDCGSVDWKYALTENHRFDKKVVSDKYKKSDTNCLKEAQYYYSCECGYAGTETFTIGTKGDCIDANKDNVCDVCKESVKERLNIYVYEQGYGMGWIEKAAQEFVKKYPNYEYAIYSDGGALEKMYTQIKYDNCKVGGAPIDIAIIDDTNYYELVSLGKLEDLSDLMEMSIPDSNQKVKEIIPQAHLDWRAVNGVQYGIPWRDNCANGIIYNKHFFETYNLEVPETMDEYFELCDEILELIDTELWDDPVYSYVEAPLVWAGAGGENAYSMLTTNQWLVEYYGYEYMTETFMNYETWEIYEETEEGRQKAYDTLAKMLQGENDDGERYALAGCDQLTSTTAQKEFLSYNPTAVMYICGSWFPNEEAALLERISDFDYGFFGIPHINDDKCTVDGEDSSNVRYSLNSNSLVIPKTSDNKAGAKLFLAELYSNYSLSAFVEENNGISRPITITPDISGINLTTKKGKFAKQVYDYYKGTTENPTKMVYAVFTAKMAGRLSPCMFGGENDHVVVDVIRATSYADALSKVDGAASRETEKVKTYWDFDANNWQAQYLK